MPCHYVNVCDKEPTIAQLLQIQYDVFYNLKHKVFHWRLKDELNHQHPVRWKEWLKEKQFRRRGSNIAETKIMSSPKCMLKYENKPPSIFTLKQ